jgi:beta-lactamase class A
MALAGCGPGTPVTAAHTPTVDMDLLNREVPKLARRLAPGRLGVGFMNLDSGEVWASDGAEQFPLQGLAAAPIASAVLAEADAGRLSLEAPITLGEMDLSAHSAIAAAWPARRDYSVRELLDAAVQGGDPTAADVLMARIGGPGAVTAWLVSKRIATVRIDRYARDIQTDMLGLAPFRPAWRTEAAFAAALATVPPAQRAQAMAAWARDPRDTATPRGMLHWLHELDDGDLLAPPSRSLLLGLMSAGKGDRRGIAAGLPRRSALARESTSGPPVQGVVPAVNDAGILTLADGRRYSLAVFITGAPTSPMACDGVIAEVARLAVRAAR